MMMTVLCLLFLVTGVLSSITQTHYAVNNKASNNTIVLRLTLTGNERDPKVDYEKINVLPGVLVKIYTPPKIGTTYSDDAVDRTLSMTMKVVYTISAIIIIVAIFIGMFFSYKRYQMLKTTDDKAGMETLLKKATNTWGW